MRTYISIIPAKAGMQKDILPQRRRGRRVLEEKNKSKLRELFLTPRHRGLKLLSLCPIILLGVLLVQSFLLPTTARAEPPNLISK